MLERLRGLCGRRYWMYWSERTTSESLVLVRPVITIVVSIANPSVADAASVAARELVAMTRSVRMRTHIGRFVASIAAVVFIVTMPARWNAAMRWLATKIVCATDTRTAKTSVRSKTGTAVQTAQRNLLHVYLGGTDSARTAASGLLPLLVRPPGTVFRTLQSKLHRSCFQAPAKDIFDFCSHGISAPSTLGGGSVDDEIHQSTHWHWRSQCALLLRVFAFRLYPLFSDSSGGFKGGGRGRLSYWLIFFSKSRFSRVKAYISLCA